MLLHGLRALAARVSAPGPSETLATMGTDPPTERHADIHGVAMRWLEWGAGPPVVLLHGIPTSPEPWRHVAPRVADARLLAWEMVGYGRSWRAGADRDISLRAQADHPARWLDHVGVERAVLVGHDLGGGVAQIVAVRRPDRCAVDQPERDGQRRPLLNLAEHLVLLAQADRALTGRLRE